MAMMAVASCVSFVACSEDNENEPGGGGKVAVNPSKVFTAGIPKQVGTMSVTTNADGLVTSLRDTEDDVKVLFAYPEMSRTESYDVVMTFVEEDEVFAECNMLLNNRGFVKYCKELCDGDVEEWWFEYNSEDQLTRMTRSEGGNEVTEITYKDGNITHVKMLSEEDDDSSEYAIGYGAPLIENKGGIMLFDVTFGIDMDEMSYAYFAGLLGKATKNLPAESVDPEYGDKETYTWMLNAKGLPEKMISTVSYNGWTDSEETSFEW